MSDTHRTQIPADHEVRLQSLDVRQSILLQAPAGSGKTELLSLRILALLAYVKKPEEILALTFTNKAAHEMQTRVLAHLSAAIDPVVEVLSPHQIIARDLAKKALANDQNQGWNLLSHPNRLQIKTIDAFNLMLVRSMPMLSKTGGLDRISRRQSKLYQDAVSTVMNSLDEDVAFSDALVLLLDHLENDRYSLQNLLADMLEKRDQWLRLGIDLHNDQSTLERIEQTWVTIIENQVEDLVEQISPYLDELLDFTSYSFYNLSQPLPSVNFRENLSFDVEYIAIWQNMLLTQNGTWRKKIDKRNGFPADSVTNKEKKAQFLAFIEILDKQVKILPLLQGLYPKPKFTEQQKQVLSALTEVLVHCVTNLQLVFIQQAEIDFTEISIRAIDALGGLNQEVGQLSLYLDNRISHVLVDEFQDTSHLQFVLLRQLVDNWMPDDGRSFFAVGDPMQSIYRFREADVGLFFKAKNEGIAKIPLRFLELSTNFRSEPHIIDWVNRQFSRIFPDEADQFKGAVNYSPSIEFSDKSTGEVGFFGYIEDGSEQETKQIVEIIKKIQSNKPEDTIGILVRKRAHMADVALQLRAAGIAYRANEIDPLRSMQVVEDWRNLTHAFCHFEARGAWLALLRAPWCGLKLVDFQALVDFDAKASIWQLMKSVEQVSTISDDGKNRLIYLRAILTRAFELKTQFPLSIILKKLWISLGGDELYPDAHDQMASQMIQAVIQTSMQHGGLNLALFEYELNGLFAPASANETIKVECMTIHKAKGLEFDTVILPKLAKADKALDQPILHWAETANGTLLAPIKARRDQQDLLYQYLHTHISEKDQYEKQRVFYVACTRAVKNLYLFATLKPTNHEPKAYARSNLSLIWDEVSEQFETIESRNNKTEHRGKKIKRIAQSHIVIPHYPLASKELKNQAISWRPEESVQTVIGTVYHACCEYLCQIDIKQISMDKILILAKNRLNSYPIDNHQMALNKVKNLLENTISDEKGRWLLDNKHAMSKQEWQISSFVDKHLRHFVIDRSFVSNDFLWVVDYKTSAPFEDETVEAFSDRMIDTYAKQLLNYQELVSVWSKYPVRMGLYCAALPLWIEL